MGTAIITLKLMPESPDIDLETIKVEATKIIAELGGEVGKEEIEPIAFGLKAVKLTYTWDESLGPTDDVEEKTAAIEGVNSAEIVDIRRALG